MAFWYLWATIPKGDCIRAETTKGAITKKSLTKRQSLKSFFGCGLQSLWHFRNKSCLRQKRWLKVAPNPSCAKIYVQKKKCFSKSVFWENHFGVWPCSCYDNRGCSPLTGAPKGNGSWCLWMQIKCCLREKKLNLGCVHVGASYLPHALEE